jgi:hypothetical protein
MSIQQYILLKRNTIDGCCKILTVTPLFMRKLWIGENFGLGKILMKLCCTVFTNMHTIQSNLKHLKSTWISHLKFFASWFPLHRTVLQL